MNAKIIKIAAFFALWAVILGAFGAHSLKEQLSPDRIAIFETGVRYQFYHAISILIIACLMYFNRSKWLTYAAYFHSFGIVCFSGSLYLLSCRYLLGIETWTWVGPITPIGGFFFILGWISLIIAFWKNDLLPLNDD